MKYLQKCGEFLVWLAALGLLAGALGCAVGRDYKRPEVGVPNQYRDQLTTNEVASLADLPWWQVFDDPVLQGLIGEAVASNVNLRAAAARVEQARALVGVARADMLPQFGYQGDASRQRQTTPTTSTFNLFDAGLSFAWELDVWGRIRRSTEAAQASLLAVEENQRGVYLSLVSSVAQNYFDLVDLDRKLEIARQTVVSYEYTLMLFNQRYHGGVDSRLPVARAKANLAEAMAAASQLEAQITSKENQLCVLLNRVPGPISRTNLYEVMLLPPSIPAGIPSLLLERRPDICQAEANMMQANALVGVAMANFFPRIGLTSLFGSQSDELGQLLKRDSSVWNVAGNMTGPIFQGGRLRSQYQAQLAQWEEAKLVYEGVVLQAFAEVASVLKNQQKLAEVRTYRLKDVESLQEAVQLSMSRFTMGMSSYYEVLESQQRLFPAQNELASTIHDQLLVLVQLYRSLGGGWLIEMPGAKK